MKHRTWEEAEVLLESMFPMPAPRREKCRALFRHAQKVRPGHAIVELGTAEGCGAIALALGAKTGVRVFTIDDFEHRRGWAAEPYSPENERTCTANFENAGVDVTIVKSSVEIAHKEWFAPIDLLHWDLGMFSGMERDFYNWEPLVVKGGKLLMHDTMDRRLGSNGLENSAAQTRRFRKAKHVGGGLICFEKRPNIIICAGMSRSGGTLQYNIVSSILREADVGTGIGYGTKVLKYRGDDLLAMKSEEPKEWLLDLVRDGQADIVGIFRDPRDVAASLIEWHKSREEITGFKGDVGDTIGFAIAWQKIWEAFPGAFMARYESYYGRWEHMVADVANFLGIELTHGLFKQIAHEWCLSHQEIRINEMKEEDLWQAQEWLLTQAHIGKDKGKIGRWQAELEPGFVKLVQVMAGKEWMANHGYRILDS